jgi:hypothetical protein
MCDDVGVNDAVDAEPAMASMCATMGGQSFSVPSLKSLEKCLKDLSKEDFEKSGVLVGLSPIQPDAVEEAVGVDLQPFFSFSSTKAWMLSIRTLGLGPSGYA